MQHCHNISTISQSANNRLVFLILDFDGIRLQNQQICRKGTFRLSPQCSLINNKGKLLRSLRNTGPSADHCSTINMPKRRHTKYA